MSMPLSTNITELVHSPERSQLLTPAASKLTKADLVRLATGATEGQPALTALTVTDLKSIQNAFEGAPDTWLAAPDSGASCCCSCCIACCCSCCAAADLQPIS